MNLILKNEIKKDIESVNKTLSLIMRPKSELTKDVYNQVIGSGKRLRPLIVLYVSLALGYEDIDSALKVGVGSGTLSSNSVANELHTAIAASTSIAGSSVIGKHCKISGQVGITGHIEIADHTTLTARTAVMKSIKESGMYSSNLFPHQKVSIWQKNVAIFRSLGKLKSIISIMKKEDNESDT